MHTRTASVILSIVCALVATAAAQETVTFDVNARHQRLTDLANWSEVHMFHPAMSPYEHNLLVDLQAHTYLMCLKPLVEDVNDNSDPEVTDFAAVKENVAGVRGGRPIQEFYPFIRECKRVSDSLVGVDPTTIPFTLGIIGDHSTRGVPPWLETAEPNTALIDTTMYAELAENIYIQCKLYKDQTGVDVSYVDPLCLGINDNYISPERLARLLATVGSYLAARGMHPTLGFGRQLDIADATRRNRLLAMIHTVFNDPQARTYVTSVTMESSYLLNASQDAYMAQVADSAAKYGVELRALLNFVGAPASDKAWPWTDVGMNVARAIPRALNVAGASSVMMQYHANFETFAHYCMVRDTIENGGGGLNDPLRKSTRVFRPEYYMLRHLFRRASRGAAYVIESSSSSGAIIPVALYDTATSGVTIVVPNAGAAELNVHIDAIAYTPGSYSVYRCSVGEKDVQLPAVAPDATITLPPASVTILSSSDGVVHALNRATGADPYALSLHAVPGTAASPAPSLCFALPSQQRHVLLTLSDMQGRVVQRLVDGSTAAGSHTVVARPGLGAGTYLAVLEAGSARAVTMVAVAR